MPATAKIFMNGNSQAVRLPVEFRFDAAEVYISRDPRTGDVVLSPKPSGSWLDFYARADDAGVPPDFMEDRKDQLAENRDIL